jgi:amidase
MTSMASKKSQLSFSLFSSLLLILLATLSSGVQAIKGHGLSSLREATVQDIRLAFKQNRLTSRRLVEFYLKQISRKTRSLRGSWR